MSYCFSIFLSTVYYQLVAFCPMIKKFVVFLNCTFMGETKSVFKFKSDLHFFSMTCLFMFLTISCCFFSYCTMRDLIMHITILPKGF